MNLTECWQLVLNAAVAFEEEQVRAVAMYGTRGMPELSTAIHKVRPKVERMQARLEALRARRAGKPLRPKWAEP